MLRKQQVSLLALLVVASGINVHAHDLLRGGDEVATYDLEDEQTYYAYESEDDMSMPLHSRVLHPRQDDRKQRRIQCDEYWLKIKCDGDESDWFETDYKSGKEVRAANVCKKECFDLGGRGCSWKWKAEGCRPVGGDGGGGQVSSIKCTKPRASRIREEGHREVCEDLAPKDKMYKCDDGSKLCCTESDMRKVTFKNKNWGQCRLTNHSDPPSPSDGGDDVEGSIKCTKPRASRIREEGHKAVCKDLAPRDVMYKCEDGTKLCCTESDMRKVTFKDKNWGQCRMKEDESV